MKKMNHQGLMKLMRDRQGERSQKDFAEELGITPQYLSDIYLGRREPGPSLLEALGIQREVVYTAENL